MPARIVLPKRTKYRNKPVVIDGFRFSSVKEARRYGELRLLEQAGKIEDLELQPRCECWVMGVFICTYVADFRYFDLATRCYVTEDVKGLKTAVYKLKKKLVYACMSIKIREV